MVLQSIRAALQPLWFLGCLGCLAVLGAGCLPARSFHCDDVADCGAGGRCEPDGYCSVADGNCGSGRRYGDAAGPHAGECVGVVGVVDGGSLCPADGDGGAPPARNECVAGAPIPACTSACAAAVCALAPSCCTVQWNERCVQLAEVSAESCPGRDCSNVLTFGGWDTPIATHLDRGGDWQSAWQWTGDGNATSLDWADQDGDGDADLVIATECGLRVFRTGPPFAGHLSMSPFWEWFPIDHDGACPEQYTEKFLGSAARWVDWSGDGWLDLVVSGARGLARARYDASLDTFVPAPAIIPDGEPPPYLADVEVADANRDGRPDLAVARGEAPAAVYLGRADGDFERAPWDGPRSAITTTWCDLAGSPDPELVALGYDQATIAVYGNPDGVLSGSPYIQVVQPGYLAIDAECGDLDRDGKTDLVVATDEDVTAGGDAGTSGPGRLLVLDSDDGAVTWASEQRFAANGVDLGDFDGDGDLDIAVSDGPVTEIAPEPFHILENQSEPGHLTFVDRVGVDLNGNGDTGRVEWVYQPLAR